MLGCLMSDGKLYYSRGAAAANVLSPKELCVRPTPAFECQQDAIV